MNLEKIDKFSGTPFPFKPEHTGIAIAYRNASYIADEVLPRVPVGKQQFEHRVFPKGQSLTIPNTLVGRKGEPNEVELKFEEVTDSTVDYGLLDKIPKSDYDNAPEGYDPTGASIEWLTDLILLDREKRAAAKVFNADSFSEANKVSATGAGQWSHADSNPLLAIENALNVPINRPNIGVFGNEVWSVLRQHPKIVKAVHGNSGDSGLVTRRQFADLFELEDIYVGQAWVNAAAKGQSVSTTRVWGKHAAFLHRNRLAGPQRGITFGYTAEFSTRIGGERPNPRIGLRGGNDVIVGESVKEVVAAGDLGYLFLNIIA